jgi:hypothetical protein
VDSYDAGSLLRRLIPYPGAADTRPSVAMSALSPTSYRTQKSNDSAIASAVAVPTAAASIVAEAASILDEEMAKGVLSARSVGQARRSDRAEESTSSVRQLHDLVDTFASLWPGLAAAAAAPATGAVVSDALPELKPRSPARPGERAIIQMTVRNKESRAVRLLPAATDLLGNNGDRIASSLLQFAQSEIRLGPGEQTDLEIALTLPREARAACYTGLLVVSGVDYLRALITIEVR